MKWLKTVIFLCLFASNGLAQKNTTFLESLMRQRPDQFDSLLNKPENYRIQIIYTQIDRDKNNIPRFKEFSYRLNPAEYCPSNSSKNKFKSTFF